MKTNQKPIEKQSDNKPVKQATPNIVRTVKKLELIKQRMKRLADAEKQAKEEIMAYMGDSEIILIFNDVKLASTTKIPESPRSFVVPEHLRLNLH